jgi:6-hydroxycyclohex-1-ene-1-carbonyl-CoA dehydrogenase
MAGSGLPLRPVEFELPEPGPNQALVRVAGCGLCHTDLGFLFDGVRPRHALPLALGHEIAGEVVAAGPGFDHVVGRAVIVPAVTPCGECAPCRGGLGSICAAQVMPGNDAHGGLATHVLVPARGLCPVPEAGALAGERLGRSECTLAELAVIADPVSTPYQAIRRAGVSQGDVAVVVGLGGVGGFAAQIARAAGARVVGFDVDRERLALLSRHGVELALDPSELDSREAKRRVLDFARAERLSEIRWRIFECSGSPRGQELAWSLLVPGGWLSVIGYSMEKVPLRLASLMALDATAQGNWGCLPELYPAVLHLVLRGQVALAPFVELHPLSEIEAVIAAAREHRLRRRPVLVPSP